MRASLELPLASCALLAEGPAAAVAAGSVDRPLLVERYQQRLFIASQVAKGHRNLVVSGLAGHGKSYHIVNDIMPALILR